TSGWRRRVGGFGGAPGLERATRWLAPVAGRRAYPFGRRVRRCAGGALHIALLPIEAGQHTHAILPTRTRGALSWRVSVCHHKMAGCDLTRESECGGRGEGVLPEGCRTIR